MKNKLLSIVTMCCLFVLIPVVASAVCPVCTVAVGAGLEGARLLGVDDVITGIWAGGLTLSLTLWTISWLKKHGVTSVKRLTISALKSCYCAFCCLLWLVGYGLFVARCNIRGKHFVGN